MENWESGRYSVYERPDPSRDPEPAAGGDPTTVNESISEPGSSPPRGDVARAERGGALEPPSQEVEGATPPGYDWPTHGGYLGCLVGTLGACPIVGFIGANIWALFRLSWLEFPLFALLALASVAAVVAAGWLGWTLGRRFYRYYPQPRPTWGESDTADESSALDAQPNPAGSPMTGDATANESGHAAG